MHNPCTIIIQKKLHIEQTPPRRHMHSTWPIGYSRQCIYYSISQLQIFLPVFYLILACISRRLPSAFGGPSWINILKVGSSVLSTINNCTGPRTPRAEQASWDKPRHISTLQGYGIIIIPQAEPIRMNCKFNVSCLPFEGGF